MRRERMAEDMRGRCRFEPGDLRENAHDLVDHAQAELLAAFSDEECSLVGSWPETEVGLHRVHRGLVEKDHALFVAFTDDGHDPAVEINLIDRQAANLRPPDSRRI